MEPFITGALDGGISDHDHADSETDTDTPDDDDDIASLASQSFESLQPSSVPNCPALLRWGSVIPPFSVFPDDSVSCGVSLSVDGDFFKVFSTCQHEINFCVLNVCC